MHWHVREGLHPDQRPFFQPLRGKREDPARWGTHKAEDPWASGKAREA